MEYKICSKCGRELEVTKNFYKKGKNSNEYRSYCKECGNNYQLKYYSKNRDARVEYQKKYETNKRNKIGALAPLHITKEKNIEII